jgi:opine dehydrogenase
MSSPIQITICGGGNSAHVAAGYIANKSSLFKVNVLSTKPSSWSHQIKVTTATSSWAHKGSIIGPLNKVSSDPQDVIPGSSIILLCAPAHVHGPILRSCSPYIQDGAMVGTIFAQGAFDWIAAEALGPETMSRISLLFGLQNIPWICKFTTYGSEARILGPKQLLNVVTYPVEAASEMSTVVTQMFDIPCSTLPNFLSVTLTPSNQIIHPARYCAIFWDYEVGKTYSKAELEERKGLTLYEDFDALSAEYLGKLDNELQSIKLSLCARFPALDLSNVMPIKERIIKGYGKDVGDTSSLLQVMRTNKGYIGCGTPISEVSEGRFAPNSGCRLFWEDVPFGLCILKGLAELCGNLPTPTINQMIKWHQTLMGKEYLLANGQLNPLLMMETGAPGRYGHHDLQSIVRTAMPSNMIRYVNPIILEDRVPTGAMFASKL